MTLIWAAIAMALIALKIGNLDAAAGMLIALLIVMPVTLIIRWERNH